MRAKTNKVYFIGIGVKPYQKKISFNMTFHMPGIIP